MTPRLAALAISGREIVLPAMVLTCIACGFAGTDSVGDGLAAGRPAVSPSRSIDANAKIARLPPPIAFGSADLAGAAVQKQKPVVTAAFADSPDVLPTETSQKPDVEVNTASLQTASLEPASLEPASLEPNANASAGSTEAADACPAADTAVDVCTDRYLWSLYQRAPKQDSVVNRESRTVTVKKKGKLVTVTKIFAVEAEEDFSWKDPKAAEAAGMALVNYVIGGMDLDFKQRLSRLLHAAEQAGLSPGITSAFRDDYRQSIANGLKAANNRSYHGGSLRGGYGHGLAADIVSVNGETRAQRLAASRTLWQWVDVHGKDFGIGRPYRGKDPMHVAPTDGQEWAVHRLGKPDQTISATKPAPKTAG